ncbi:putative lipid II flippase FtsW [Teredinibacter sp. KSP-S5-2]|uniref:putative lipid II flippase FtsW n=1 Tax=Teredinibacter sp. KSP-S5-2 TaxID=3034506 RepID=UPI002934D7EE|nr:putative lipid II flippase FtsW [Teredinibacter sp. KSP-S5-2]WNO09617.1 putative lipid II flippase FtsW [Teredinibacter sp. KSP-S5-2]
MLGHREAVQSMNVQSLNYALLAATAALLSIGLIAVATSSLDFAAANYGDPWIFVKKQSVYMCMGLVGALFIASVPMRIWEKYASALLLLALLLLAVVLVPGIGKTVNGSRRWLNLGFLTMQASEIAKFCLIIYFASYLSRKSDEVRHQWFGFIKLIFILGMVVLLLLLEPDFGSSVVIATTLAGMMFLAGVPLFRFMTLAAVGGGGFVAMIWSSPYRWERLVAFMDPWARQFDSGYQLVQSLIAFGRGEWLGVGLGNSLQKLFFLPEAHTDFIFAILAEEFGLLGVLCLIGLYIYFVYKILHIAKQAGEQNRLFSAYLAFGIGLMLAIQSFFNMGVASGLLPTKGLTLPFISYGGSSLLITFGLIALVFRVHWELKNAK